MAIIDVNIQSVDGSGVLYAVLQASLPCEAGGPALDFVRTQIDGAPMIT